MRVMTILGTRPEIIRLSLVIKRLDSSCDHILVHTGQNYTETLSDVFFRDLGLRQPDYMMGINTSKFGDQVGQILAQTEKLLEKEKPDKVLILGDTNSGLSAIAAKRKGIKVYHMEAGNRCYDDRVPEEINRRIIDHSSDILLPYTNRSKENLVKEGIQRERIFVTGNPIFEVLVAYENRILTSDVFSKLALRDKQYMLVTLHRAENVDNEERLRSFVEVFEIIAKEYQIPIIISLHPRTRQKLVQYGMKFCDDYIRSVEPLGFFDFVALEKHAFCVISDSGTVQEECCIFGVPNITIRDVTERPETIECGSNVITGNDCQSILSSLRLVTSLPSNWNVPIEYQDACVSQKILRIMHNK